MLSGVVAVLFFISFAGSGNSPPLLHFSELRPRPAGRSAGHPGRFPLLSFADLRTHDISIAPPGESSRVTVLPFFNIGAKAEYQWLSREFAEALADDLSSVPGLTFVGRGFLTPLERKLSKAPGGRIGRKKIANIARRVGADVAVVGRYAVGKNDIRADIQTMRLSTRALSGVISVAGPADKIWEVEAGLAERLADLLGVRLSDDDKKRIETPPTESPIAFREYRQAVYSPEGSHRKIEHLEKAVQADPSFARAYYLLGNAYRDIGTTYRYVEWFNKALDAYRKAVAIEPSMAEAYSAMGAVYMLNGRYGLSRRALEKALTLDPDLKPARGYLRRLSSMDY